MNSNFVRFTFVILVVTLFVTLFSAITGHFTAAQTDDNETVSLLSDTTPPNLRIIIMLDDSGTMESSNTNTIAYGRSNDTSVSFSSAPPGNPTDPNEIRHDAVRQIVNTLAGDSNGRHQVAVLSFDRYTQVWLPKSADSSDSASYPFVDVGGSIQSPEFISGYESGSSFGLTHLALNTIDQLLRNPQTDQSGSRKTVILLITDDVPVQEITIRNTVTFASPYTNTASFSDWLALSQNFESTLTNLQDALTRYTAERCVHNEGKLIMATMAMGAANWVSDRGNDTAESWRVILSGRNDTPGQYFYGLARRTGAISLRDSQPLAYSIVPYFGDDSLMRDDFYEAINALMTELRCTTGDYLSGEETTNVQEDYTFTISPLHRSFSLSFNLPDTAAAQVTAPNGATRSVSQPGMSIIDFNRDDFEEGEWAGNWHIVVNGNNAASTKIYLDAVVVLHDLEIDFANEGEGYSLGQAHNISFTLTVDGRPIDYLNDPVIAGLSVKFQDDTHPLIPTETGFRGTIQSDQSDTYNLEVQLSLKVSVPPYSVNQPIPLKSYPVQFASEIILQIRDFDLQDCSVYDNSNNDAQAHLTVALEAGNDDSITSESLFTYTRVIADIVELQPMALIRVGQDSTGTEAEGEASTSLPTLTPTPAFSEVIVNWSGRDDGLLTADIPCNLIPLGEGKIQASARLPMEDVPAPVSKAYTLEPTSTPTLTPTLPPSTQIISTPLPTPTFTPAPVPDPLTSVVNTATTPPISDILRFIFGGVIAAGLVAFALSIQHVIWPLTRLQQELEDGRRVPVGTFWNRINIFRQVYVEAMSSHVASDDGEDDNLIQNLFSIRPQRQTDNLIIEAIDVDIQVDGYRVPRNTTITTLRDIVTIHVLNKVYIFINKNRSRR